MSELQRLRHAALLHRFAASFAELDDGFTTQNRLEERARRVEEWYVMPWITDAAELNGLYSALPAKFPELYEQFVLSYRWSAVDLRICRLLANPVGDSLEALREAVIGDRAMSDVLLPAGFIPFARGPDISYDPVCFDTRAASNDQADYPIVRLNHEEALCAGRVKVVEQMAMSFEHFVERILESAGGMERGQGMERGHS